jgi:hypothetical protein
MFQWLLSSVKMQRKVLIGFFYAIVAILASSKLAEAQSAPYSNPWQPVVDSFNAATNIPNGGLLIGRGNRIHLNVTKGSLVPKFRCFGCSGLFSAPTARIDLHSASSCVNNYFSNSFGTMS